MMSFTSGIDNLQRVTNSTETAPTKPVAQVSASDSVTNEQPVADVKHADQTDFSSTGSFVAKALEGSDVRPAKVASLQQAIAAGSYSVSSSDVADKIIQSLLE